MTRQTLVRGRVLARVGATFASPAIFIGGALAGAIAGYFVFGIFGALVGGGLGYLALATNFFRDW